MTELTSTTTPDFVSILTKAAALELRRGDRPTADAVVSALLQAEKAAKQQALSVPLTEALLGEWRLRFVAPRKPQMKAGVAQGRGFYLPQWVVAQISFAPGTVTSDSNAALLGIGNQLQLGPLGVQFAGPAQPLGKKNLLTFDFTDIKIMLLGRRVYGGEFGSGKARVTDVSAPAIAQLPFFVFFCMDENFIAARGRGGGLALWVRVS